MAIKESDLVTQIQFQLQDFSPELEQKIKDGIANYALPQIQTYYDWDWRYSDIKTLATVANKKTYDFAADVSPAITDFGGMISVKDITNERLLSFYAFPDFDRYVLDENTKGDAVAYTITKDDKLQPYPVYDTVVTINFRYKINVKLDPTAKTYAIRDEFRPAIIEGTLLYVLPRMLADKVTPNPVWQETRITFFNILRDIKNAFPRQSQKVTRMKLGSTTLEYLQDVSRIKDYAIR